MIDGRLLFAIIRTWQATTASRSTTMGIETMTATVDRYRVSRNRVATKYMRTHCSHLLDEDATQETLETIADAIMHHLDSRVHVTELISSVDSCHTDAVDEGVSVDNLFGLQPVERCWYSQRSLVIRTNRDGVPIAAWFTVQD